MWVISIFMSQRWPFRGSERTFFPLRGLKKGGLFIAKGAAREKQGRFFFEFSPYHTFLLHLIRSTVSCARLYSQCPWTILRLSLDDRSESRGHWRPRGHWLIGCPSYGCPLSCCLARPGRPSYRWACEDHGAPQSRESSCLHDPARLSPGCSTRRISRGNHEAL